MRVLHLGKFFPPFFGGIENFMADLLRQQCADGLVVSAIVHQHRSVWQGAVGSMEPWPETARRDAHEPTVSLQRMPIIGRMLFTPLAPLALLQLASAIRRERPDLLHIHLPNPTAFWLLLLPSARRLPWVLHWHADVIGSEASLLLRLTYWLTRPFEKAMLKRCHSVICTSPNYAQFSRPLAPFVDKQRIVPLGLVEQAAGLAAAQAQPSCWQPRQPGRYRLLAVGRLTYYKGFDLLLRALAETPAWELCLVGEGDRQAQLQGLLAEFKLADRMRLLGRVGEQELAELLHSCDCLVLPSIERTEAFGVVLLEAMRAGKATLAADVQGSGMGWVVEQGKTGLLFEAGELSSLREQLEELAQSPERLQALGAAGRARFEQQFRIDRVAARLAAVYREALADGVAD